MNIDIEQAAIHATQLARKMSPVVGNIVWSSCPRDMRLQLEADKGYAFFCNQFFAYLTTDAATHGLNIRFNALQTVLSEFITPFKGRSMYNWGKLWQEVADGLLIERADKICEQMNTLIQHGALPLPAMPLSTTQLKRQRQKEKKKLQVHVDKNTTEITINGVKLTGAQLEEKMAKMDDMFDNIFKDFENKTKQQNDAFSDVMKNHMKRFGK